MRKELIIEVLKSGVLSSIQDLGRNGFRAYGVPVGGAMDKDAAKQANYLVGNPPGNPAIEATLIGPWLKFHHKCQIAITGADLSAKLDGETIEMHATIDIDAGRTLSFGRVNGGCRAYIAVGGNWDLTQVMGGYSGIAYSNMHSGILSKGDVIRIATHEQITKRVTAIEDRPDLVFPKTIRVLPGPEFEWFSRLQIADFFSKSYTIGVDANRMGYRLNEKLYGFNPRKEMVSSGIIPGTIQVTGDGWPMVLMADAQTTGGYYRIANVVSEDLTALAQAKPGDRISFRV